MNDEELNSSINEEAEDIKATKGNDAIVFDSKSEDSPEGKRENTRSKIAHFYVYAFFGTIAVSFLIGACNRFAVKDYGDLLITVSGILSGPLGFIIGYYFKASTKEQ